MSRRLNLGKKLRESWMGFDDADWEPLTFGDLKVGDRYIAMPSPGDGHGHGGFRNGSWLFMKTEMKIKLTPKGIKYAFPHGEAIDEKGAKQEVPHHLLVLKVARLINTTA